MAPVVEARGLWVRRGGRDVVRGLDLEVAPGEVVCLLGGNGAGKTTTLHALLGLVAPARGTVEVLGRSVSDSPLEARRRLAYLPEQLSLYPRMTGLENLRYLSALAGGPVRDEAGWLSLCGELGVARDDARRDVGVLSKGTRQKLGIVLALSRGAAGLLLDEPTSGLDPTAASELERLVLGYAGRGGAVLMVTHDLFRARQTADRVGILRNGQLEQLIEPRQLDPGEFEQRYLRGPA